MASSHGAVAFGVTHAGPFDEARAKLREHRESGLSGPLHFTYDDPDTATDVRQSFPWARSLVVFAHNYLPDASVPRRDGPVIARFATSDQYEPLRKIGAALVATLTAADHRSEVLIDDNRLVDRTAAARAGVGWLGKSTMLLAPGHGPWLLLGTVVTDADLDHSESMTRGCGTCVACIPACPTDAITARGLDAGRCISTWLQATGPIPRWIRPLIGRRIYGCDDCLTSCPPGHPTMRRVEPEPLQASFGELLGLDDDSLIERFGWFYIPHREPRYLRRNLLVAAGNSEEASAIPAILAHLDHRSSLVRGHAYWALARSLGSDAWTILRECYPSESVPDARRELEEATLMLREPNGR